MLEFLYNLPFLVLEPPNLKLKRISVPIPSAKTVFFVVLLSYFLVCAGELVIFHENNYQIFNQTIFLESFYQINIIITINIIRNHL